MAESNLAQTLFDAISLITERQVSDLPYDKTIIATITDASNAEKGEYTVTDTTSTFEAYSEKTDYTVNMKVYVTVPNGDMLNKKYISGQYIESEVEDPSKYVSPMDSFVDLTGDITNTTLTKGYSLLANHPTRLTKQLWTSGSVEYRNYTCIGLQAEFMTQLSNLHIVSGAYGLRLLITYETTTGKTLTTIMYFNNNDMFGNSYGFNSYYKQEKVFSLQELDYDKITEITLEFYQNNDFLLKDKTRLPYCNQDDNGNNLEPLTDNLWVNNVELKLGILLTDYTEDKVYLICNEDLKYNINRTPKDRQCYVRWVHLMGSVEDGTREVLVVDENEDFEITVETEDSIETEPAFNLRWYKYTLKEGVQDPLAGNYWTEITKFVNDRIDNEFQRKIQPDNTVQQDKYKIIIEYPTATAVIRTLNESSDLAVLREQLDTELGSVGYLNTLHTAIDQMINEADTVPAVEALAKPFTTDSATYPGLIGNDTFSSIVSFIKEAKGSIQFYSSDILTFENEIHVDMEPVDLVQGLHILVDNDVDGFNGVYRLYDESHNIINQSEARKTRYMTATYTSIATGDDSLNQAEEILWCFPLSGSMIESPEEEKEYSLVNHDSYFTVDNLSTAMDNDAAQGQRLDELKRLRPNTYATDIELTIDDMYIQRDDEIVAVQSDGQYTTQQRKELLDNINKYYECLLAYLLNNNYQSYIVNFANTCAYGVIRRQGSEIAGNTSEQLINVQQTFRIKNYYVENCTNNTVYCLVKKNGRIYQAEAIMHFGTAGTSGTEATLILTMCNENGYEVSALTEGTTVYIRPYLYNYNNELIPFDDTGVQYKWFTKPAVPESIELIAQAGTECSLATVDANNRNFLDYAHGILQADTKYTITYSVENNDATPPDGEELPPVEKQREVKLTAYLPIAVRASAEMDHISGATQIIYDSNGSNPVYYKEAYQVHTASAAYSETQWRLEGTGRELIDPITKRYYPSLSIDNELTPSTMYYDNIKPISAVMSAKVGFSSQSVQQPDTFVDVWIQPILIIQNKYGSAMLNNWDGSLQIDEENGTILSAMVGAGIKNEDNTFSGVLMGNVALADERIGNKTGLGLYGFHHGDQSFGLNVDGTAFFGKAGSGRIEFDGNKGIIQSYNYQEPKTTSGTTTPGSGLQIDLDDSTFNAFGRTGSVQINTSEYGKPLFVIRDANFLDSNMNKGNTLFYVSSNAYDEATGKTYDAKYFLQSSNYTSVDPTGSNDPDAPPIEYKTGALFDLEKGKLDIHGKAGRVFIHGDGTNDLFQIKGWMGDTASTYQTNVLMNVSPKRYYLQSLNYKANVTGFKLDIMSGKLLASDFSIKAGTQQTGYIQLSSTGQPYLSISSGTDFIEEEHENADPTYACYDAIDLEDVDAQFAYEPTNSPPIIYYVRNKQTAGYYPVEDYHETLYVPQPGDDADTLNMQWYYRYNEANDTYIPITTMYPEEYRSFEESLLPDHERIYKLRDYPIELDESPLFTENRQYYADSAGQQPVTLLDNTKVILFSVAKKDGLLYRRPKQAIRDDGTIGFKENRIYYTVDDETKPEIERVYTPFRNIVGTSAGHVVWEKNKYFFKTVLGQYLKSTSTWNGNQTYYLPKDEATYSLTQKEVAKLSDDKFKPVGAEVVSPTTYFYDTPSTDANYKILWYYDQEWTQVAQDEVFDDTSYFYGRKYRGVDNYVNESLTVVDSTDFIYQPSKWYYQNTSTTLYDELTEWVVLDTYYCKWYDSYIACSVIEKETNNIRIFKPNKYFRYIANKPFLPATEFENGETYYTDITGEHTIRLCDYNCEPYTDVGINGRTKEFKTVHGTTSVTGELYTLFNGVYNAVNLHLNTTTNQYEPAFDAAANYFIRYDLGQNLDDPTSGVHSVKLVNITTNRFELKSHNWNDSNAGMHYYITSNADYDDSDNVPRERGADSNPGLNGENEGNPVRDNQDTQFDSDPTVRKVGGGYIEGYGFYKVQDGEGYAPRYPKFTLDWRAGVSHAPISIKLDALDVFKVAWNGRVDILDLHAEKGFIGSWYLDKKGIYSYNPDANIPNKTGVALFSRYFDTVVENESMRGIRIFAGTITGGLPSPTASEQTGTLTITGTYTNLTIITISHNDENIQVYDYGKAVTTTDSSGNTTVVPNKVVGYTNIGCTESPTQFTLTNQTILGQHVQFDSTYRLYKIDNSGTIYYFPFTSSTASSGSLYFGTHQESGSWTEIKYQWYQNGSLVESASPPGPEVVIDQTSGEAETVEYAYTGYNEKSFWVTKTGDMSCYGAHIKGAEIENGRIQNASIVNGTITAAKINNCQVGSLYGGTIKGATIIGGYINGGTIIGGSISGASVTTNSLTATGGTVGGFTIGAGSLTNGNTQITNGFLQASTVNGTAHVWSDGWIGTSGRVYAAGEIKGGSLVSTGDVSGGAATFSSLTVGEGTVQMEVAGCTITELKTALGLGELAYADDVTKNFNVSLTATVSGGSDSQTVYAHLGGTYTGNPTVTLNYTKAGNVASKTVSVSVSDKSVTFSKKFSNTTLTAGSGDVSLTATSGVTVS